MGRSAKLTGLAAGICLLLTGASSSATASDVCSLTAKNRAIVTAFAHEFYDQRDVRKAFETYVAPDYVQHSPGIADGREAAIRFLTPMFHRPGFKVKYRPPIVDGDMAAIMIHAPSEGKTGGAIVDLFRLRDGKIVEHWDVNQLVPVPGVNPHPLF